MDWNLLVLGRPLSYTRASAKIGSNKSVQTSYKSAPIPNVEAMCTTREYATTSLSAVHKGLAVLEVVVVYTASAIHLRQKQIPLLQTHPQALWLMYPLCQPTTLLTPKSCQQLHSLSTRLVTLEDHFPRLQWFHLRVFKQPPPQPLEVWRRPTPQALCH